MTERVGEIFDWAERRLYTPVQVRQKISEFQDAYSAKGLKAGHREIICAENRAETLFRILALWSMGCSVVPLDPRLTKSEHDSLCSQVDKTAGHEERLILFTTGTMSAPKGVVLTASALESKINILGKKLPLNDLNRMLCVLPLSFGHGLMANSLVPWLNGVCLTIAPLLDPVTAQEFPIILQEQKITAFSSVPGMWAILSRMIEPPENSGVKRIFCASAPMTEKIFNEIKRFFPDANLHNVFGMTEMSSWVAMTPPLTAYRSGWIGHVLDGEMKVNEGRLEVRGPSRMRNYLGHPELEPSSWFSTGDLAEKKDDGFFLKGREGWLINRGGVKIQLEEIENILNRHEFVKESAGFRTTDEEGNESYEVAIVLDANSRLEAVQKWFFEQVSPHRRPSSWHCVKVIPHDYRGKVDRSRLKIELSYTNQV